MRMITETTTFSECTRSAEAARNTFKRPGFLKRSRHFIEFSDWDEMIRAFDEWLKRGCIGVIIVSALYFFPVVIKALLK
jgi:hypothetical protein